MSAFPPIADILTAIEKGPLMTQSGHRRLVGKNLISVLVDLAGLVVLAGASKNQGADYSFAPG